MSRSSLDLSQPKQAHTDQRLRTDAIIWLGTVRPGGRPHLVPVWFLWDGDTILIFSKNDHKIRNLQGNNRVMLALDDTKGGGDVVMVEGEATLLERGSVTPALPAYAQKYAQQLAQYKWTGESMGREYTEPISITPAKFHYY
ncbi:MAG TPA: pyridoxamine 5'-phosphate oxidase family protein [Chloroflexia bacterium]|nr:pyridoxamine 5'-phosphate oxidase family protein [Chloroflexia bacterium]